MLVRYCVQREWRHPTSAGGDTKTDAGIRVSLVVIATGSGTSAMVQLRQRWAPVECCANDDDCWAVIPVPVMSVRAGGQRRLDPNP